MRVRRLMSGPPSRTHHHRDLSEGVGRPQEKAPEARLDCKRARAESFLRAAGSGGRQRPARGPRPLLGLDTLLPPFAGAGNALESGYTRAPQFRDGPSAPRHRGRFLPNPYLVASATMVNQLYPPASEVTRDFARPAREAPSNPGL